MNKVQINRYLLITLIYTALSTFFCLIANFCPKLARDFSKYEEQGTFLIILQVVTCIGALYYLFITGILYRERDTLNLTRPGCVSSFSIFVRIIGPLMLCVTIMVTSFDDPPMLKVALWIGLIFLLNLSQLAILLLRFIVSREN
ncbi:unnamed protein product [Bursaphelenchus xylophilus]|uniref:(pine wood nematode) hypothetical protein n=1 Tax=Bursaphelenchus xylophilus TaxID=6326 RepID=A0A1I7S2D8_BURXY|nr:unnamed protein product [Bursaphelenchus xylophilus]CAG9114641.1 unnamed protein product [Bursaphelenchus xylophilus]